MNKIVFTLLWIVSLCYASKNYTKLRFLDYVLIVLLTYGMYDAWKQTDEHFTASGYSEGMDPKAYENLHRIVKELYNNDTLTIPGNVKIEGNLDVNNNIISKEGSLTVKHNLKANATYTNNLWNNTVDYMNIEIRNHSNGRRLDDKHINVNSKLVSNHQIHAKELHRHGSASELVIAGPTHIGWGDIKIGSQLKVDNQNGYLSSKRWP